MFIALKSKSSYFINNHLSLTPTNLHFYTSLLNGFDGIRGITFEKAKNGRLFGQILLKYSLSCESRVKILNL